MNSQMSAKEKLANVSFFLILGLIVVAGVMVEFLAVNWGYNLAFLTPILQGSVLAAIVGGIFKTLSDAITARQKMEQFRFEKIYPKQVEVIEKLHQTSVELEAAMQSLVNPLQMGGAEGQKQVISKVADIGNELRKSLSENRIYLRSSLCDSLEQMIEQHLKIWWRWNVALNATTPATLPSIEEWIADWKKAEKDLPVLRKRLEDEYREIFGIR